MNNYIVDRAILEQAVDALIAQKFPGQNPSQNLELASLREASIGKLDHYLSTTIFSYLSDEKLQELNQLLEKNEEDPAVFEQFFANSGINLDEAIQKALAKFSQEFLGGQNA